MPRNTKIAVQALSIAMAAALLVCAGVYALPALLYPRINANAKVVIDGEAYRFSDLGAMPLASPAQSSPTPDTSPAAKENALPRVGSMAMLLHILKENGALYAPSGSDLMERSDDFLAVADKTAAAPMATAPPVMGEADAGGRESGLGYSETNTRTAGVDEGDIVKTDGRYIYTASSEGGVLSIVEADGADMTLLSEIRLADGTLEGEYRGFVEMYVQGDFLVLVSSRVIAPEVSDGLGAILRDSAVPDIWRPSKQLTRYTVYDITDRKHPEETRVVELEGSPLATRMIGSTLYVTLNKGLYNIPFTTDLEGSDVLPAYGDSVVSGELRTISPADIRYFPDSPDSNYLLVGALDITGDEAFVPQAYLGAGSDVYMSRESLYVVRSDWRAEGGQTLVYRFAVDGPQVDYAGTGKIEGLPINQYAMDEFGGYFRVATTSWGENGSESHVTILDSELRQVGITEALAPGESIYSVRFMGDMGYVVTFRQVDPLFAIDLSSPENPVVTGQLKIPGFSQYLHPVGDGLLVGFGRHTQETYVRNDDGSEEIVGTRDAGLKISLFDVSDPYNPREVDSLRLGMGSWSEAFDNPRAMMVDSARRQFGFPVQVYDYTASSPKVESWEGYMVISVQGGRLVREAELKTAADGAYHGWQRRLCVIRDTLYAVDDLGVTAYDYQTFALLGSLKK